MSDTEAPLVEAEETNWEEVAKGLAAECADWQHSSDRTRLLLLDALFVDIDDHSKLVSHAAEQLLEAGMMKRESELHGGLGQMALDMVRLFALLGHKGYPVEKLLDLLSKLLRHEPLDQSAASEA